MARKPLIARLGMCAGVFCASVLGCDRPPAADELTSWTPTDHHSTDDGKLATGAQARPAAAGSRPATGETAQLVDLAWRQQCASCHGPLGKGDGQMGPMVRAPDLTREEWQAKTADGDIAATIKNGKGKMPKFGLPDSVIQGLVARIRAARGR
ncbi:MAG: cytochrome c [Myxococcota bacterium]|nr:cytochrome c [Myxococcota bacterium]